MTRSVAVKQTLNKARKHIDSKIIHPPERIDFKQEFGVPTYVCKHKISRNLDVSASPSHQSLHRFIAEHAMGKGQTEEQAQASAMCEALERYCAATWEPDELVISSYNDICNQAISPLSLVEFTQDSLSRFKKATSDPRVCTLLFGHEQMRPFTPDMPMHWVHGYSLVKNKPVFVPAYSSLIFTTPPVNAFTCTPMNTNGLSLGNNFEEAVLQGFYEVLERDAIAIFMRNIVSLPDVDLETSRDPFVKRIHTICSDNGIDVSVKDFTTDFGIPIFCAQFYDADQFPNYFFGFGSHLNPEIALTRAITEAFQGRSSHAWIEKNYPEELKGTEVLPAHEALINTGPRKMGLQDYSTSSFGNLKSDLEYCLKKTTELGMDIVVVDLSVPEVDFVAVKVLVVGSAHCDTMDNPFFISRRIFDVPVKLGLPQYSCSGEHFYWGPLIT